MSSPTKIILGSLASQLCAILVGLFLERIFKQNDRIRAHKISVIINCLIRRWAVPIDENATVCIKARSS